MTSPSSQQTDRVSDASDAADPAARDDSFAGEFQALLRLAGPIVLSQLGQIGMNTADTIMVGPLGARPLAAAGLGSALHMVALMVPMGILIGMVPLVSQAFGAGARERCRRVLQQGLWLSLVLSLPVAAVSIWGAEIALLFGQAPVVATLTGDYLIALLPGIAPALLFVAFRQYLEGMGIARPTMIMTLIGLGVNIVANYILIYGVDGTVPALGLAGSGWATSIVRGVMLVAMLAFLRWRPDLHPFRGGFRRIDRALLGQITTTGLPVGMQIGLEVGFFSFAAVMMGWIGPIELASHQVTINIAATTFMVALGVSIAGSIRVGQHIGADHTTGVHQATLTTYILAIGFMGICAVVFLALPGPLVRLYTSDPAIVELAGSLLGVAALFQIFDGAQVAGVGTLRGAADTKTPMVVAGLGYWGIGVPVGLLLGFRTTMGPVGIWIGLCIGLAAVAAMLGIRVRRILWGGDYNRLTRP